MINLPYNASPATQIMPCQSVPVQTSQNNFQSFHQPQTASQQMQTSPYAICPGNPQDAFLKGAFHPGIFASNQQPNVFANFPSQPIFPLPSSNVPTALHVQPPPNPPQNILEQIRGPVSNAAPIFILPGGCHQAAHQQSTPTNQGAVSQSMGQPGCFNYPPPVYCPPSFYPYPIPLPIYEPLRSKSCECDRHREHYDFKNHRNCCFNPDDHRCNESNDTVCPSRNCPSSLSLQALASQLLSVPGIISCATTRLILRKIPGSNVVDSMEETVEKAQRALSALKKDQLLAESRAGQRVTALINLHVTGNLPAYVVPMLTLLQLKVNLLKAQVEGLISQKLMESQGYCVEIETAGEIDPAFLAVRTDPELRQVLSALRKKECDERVNVNFSPYHSQRVIAEARLANVQNKIRQVEREFERRRCATFQTPTLTSGVIQQFSQAYCFAYPRYNVLETIPADRDPFDSPDAFSVRNPRRLCLKPRGSEKATNTTRDASTSKDVETEGRDSQRCSANCSCDETSSNESLDEDKKKLRFSVDPMGNATITSNATRDVSLMKLAPNADVVAAADDTEKVIAERVEFITEPVAERIERASIYVQIGEPSKVRRVPENEEIFWEFRKNSDGAADSWRNILGKGEKVEASIRRVEESQANTFTSDEEVDGDNSKKHFALVKFEREQSKDVPAVKERGVKAENFDNPATVKEEPDDGHKAEEFQFETARVKIEPESADDMQTIADVEGAESAVVKKLKVEPKTSVASSSANDGAELEETRKMPGGLIKSVFHVRLNPVKRKKSKERENEAKDDWKEGKNEINIPDQEQAGGGKAKHERIVSMMTSIKYDRSYSYRWMEMGRSDFNEIEDRPGNDFTDDPSVVNVESLREDCADRSLLSRMNPSGAIDEESCEKLRTNAPSRLDQNYGFSGRPESDTEKITKEVKLLQRGEVNANENATEGNSFRRRGEIESTSSRKTICDRSTSYGCDTEKNSIVSVVYSAIGASFGSLLENIPTLRDIFASLRQSVLSNGESERISFWSVLINDRLGEKLSHVSERKNKKGNKSKLRGLKDWKRLLASSFDSRGDRETILNRKPLQIFLGKDRKKVHTRGHSIIANGKKCTVIRGLISDRRRLATVGLNEPYKIRRSLIVRSKLKNPENRSESLRPLTVWKRSENNKVATNRTEKMVIFVQDKTRILKAGGKFRSLPAMSELLKTSTSIVSSSPIESNGEPSLNNSDN